MSIFKDYLKLLEKKKELDDEITGVQCLLYELNAAEFNDVDSGVVNFEQDGYKLSITKKMTVKVDQTLASVVNVGFSLKYSIDKKIYNSLSDTGKKRVDECLTETPAKPAFKVVKL